MHGLPLTYNKDMQEDKEHLFDAVDTLELCLAAARGMIESMTFRRDRMARRFGDEFLAATDIADLLVRRGCRSASAHGVVAACVRRGLRRGGCSELPRGARGRSDAARRRVYAVLADEAWLECKVAEGGPSLARVREQVVGAATRWP